MSTLILPNASLRPPGSVTIGTTDDQRTGLREGVILIAAGFLLGGLGVGYLIGRRRKPNSNPRRRKRQNPDGDRTRDVDACRLGKWAWDKDPAECGADPPDPSTAAKRLANKRWTLPPGERRLQARVLRGGE